MFGWTGYGLASLVMSSPLGRVSAKCVFTMDPDTRCILSNAEEPSSFYWRLAPSPDRHAIFVRLFWQQASSRNGNVYMKHQSETLREYDTAHYLKTGEDIARYLNACLDECGDDPAMIAHAFGVVARTRGMSKIARQTGLNREGLYKALSQDGNPEFATILKVANALGVRFRTV